MENQISEWKASTWRIRPTLDMPDLEPEAVQFAVLEKDPIDEVPGAPQKAVMNASRHSSTSSTLLSPDVMKRLERTALMGHALSEHGGDQVQLLASSKKDGRIQDHEDRFS